MNDAEFLSGLAAMSARIGADPLLIQGAGGNSSLKQDGRLWVKASGQWLAEADEKPIFVPLSMAALRDSAGMLMDEAPPSSVIAECNPAGLRPSIEAMLHAIMPHRIVVHAHAVNAMAVSVLAEGRALAGERLRGLRWTWIGYHRPGAPLARAVREAIEAEPADVLILQNHGVVVGAEDIAAAEALLAEVEQRLVLEPREAPPAQPAWQPSLGDDFERHPLASTWALDAHVANVLTRYTLVPDQVVFLGGPIPNWEGKEAPGHVATRIASERGIEPAILMCPGLGAVAARNRTAATEAMLVGLLEVARRLPSDIPPVGLSPADVAALTNWDAERYRRNIDAARQ